MIPQEIKIVAYMGRPISMLSKKELVIALDEMNVFYRRLLEEKDKIIGLYKPKQ